MLSRSEKTAGNLFSAVLNTPAVQDLRRRLENGSALSFHTVSGSAQPFFSAMLRELFPTRPIVVVTSGLKTQELFHQDIASWRRVQSSTVKVQGSVSTLNVEPGTLNFYPAWEVFPHEAKLPHVDVISDRLETLVALSNGSEISDLKSPIVVTSVSALLQKTFPAGEIQKRTRVYKRGDSIDPLDLVEWLEEQGYEPEAEVTQKGELALRGGILDLWPLTSPWPVRLEFFGNDLDSLRYFEPLSQISREEIPSVTIPPGGELGILKRGRVTSPVTLLDYLPHATIFVLCEPDLLDEQADRYAQQTEGDDPFFISWTDFREQIAAKGMSVVKLSEMTESESFTRDALFTELEVTGGMTSAEIAEGDLKFQSLEVYRPIGDRPPEPQIAEAQRKEFFSQLHRWLRQNYEVHVFCNNDGEKQRFEEIWREYGFGEVGSARCADRTSEARTVELTSHSEVPRDVPTIHLGALARGFLFEPAKLVVVTDAEIFGRYKIQRPRRLKSPHAQTTKSLLDIDFTELEPGDYVVHLQHGIGRYLGLQVLPSAHGRKQADGSLRSEKEDKNLQGQECLVIEYAAGSPDQEPPKLYVPVTEAHLVSKYVGAGKARPQLNTIGGTRWAKAKQQAENAVRDLASEMLRIQAVRESQAGHSFPPDTTWQREFESSFLYEETPDQMRAIIESKADMEKPKPMDRLICGDVGYGKTEVAIRAAFKAVMGGRQVAILVPTTVLAQQHFNTFRERMSDYPVKIELLSRFRSRREQSKVIENLVAGAVDIVIGTHRLIQSDIVFKDLGLVVIDEEQRFGVAHKEKFKQLRTMVDVLTLSATPIPRTLYLALTGARDMSTIETPPQDRLPVETIVTQYDERVIRDAIRREMNRQGQVFFLHNRVSTIDLVAMKLKSLVPDARILVGHGQMDADELEEVMTKFVNGEADVLLSTTIIESGLDIPNANTIIIDRADRFGLSELYQLRGRVGRYKHQAYAYLLLPRHAGLLVDARKRLSAIKQYSSLGSGFKIAMRDLEIRGAGNLLGPQQSGHITAVGFDLYCQLLKQSVSSLKGEKVKPRIEVETRLDFLSMSPDDEAAETFNAQRSTSNVQRKKPQIEINVPRETGVYISSAARSQTQTRIAEVRKASAYIPFDYISESRHRVEIYRKLPQANDKASLDKLKKELRDRFGPIPPAVELLLQVAELKVLAASKNISAIETEEDKLKLVRHGDFIQLGGKFPRLTKKDAKARLNEIKKLLLALN